MKAKGYNTDWEWYQENIKDYDLMVLGRTSFLRTVESFCIIRKYGDLPLVVDFDDHYAHVPDYNCAAPVSHQSGSAPKASKIQLLSADAATVTTEPLVRFYHDQARSITVLPNCVDPADWQDLRVDPERANDSSLRIVFAGGAGRYGDLLLCREAIETIAASLTGPHDGVLTVRIHGRIGRFPCDGRHSHNGNSCLLGADLMWHSHPLNLMISTFARAILSIWTMGWVESLRFIAECRRTKTSFMDKLAFWRKHKTSGTGHCAT
jgi:hypothetical protein